MNKLVALGLAVGTVTAFATSIPCFADNTASTDKTQTKEEKKAAKDKDKAAKKEAKAQKKAANSTTK